MSEWRLVIETSGSVGHVGLARGNNIVQSARLDPKRRHVRDLSSTVSRLLECESIQLRQLHAILVSIGPGGYTGLRVGLATAKTLAYASQIPLVAVPTFAAIAAQAPNEARQLWIIADALQGQIYHQRFQDRMPLDELKIAPVDEWLSWTNRETWISGPGVEMYRHRCACDVRIVEEPIRLPHVEGVLRAAERFKPLSREELFRIEPLYMRGSSAEEKAKRAGSNE